MNAMMHSTTDSRNSALPTVTIGAIRSCHAGEIVLVYLNEGKSNAAVLRYDQLSRKEKGFIRAVAQDPLSVLDHMKTSNSASH